MADKFRNIQELAAELVELAKHIRVSSNCDKLERLAVELEQRIATQLELNRALLAELRNTANRVAKSTSLALEVHKDLDGIACSNGHVVGRECNFCAVCGANMRAVK